MSISSVAYPLMVISIVASTGFYMENNYPAEIATMSEDQIADELVRQANEQWLGAFGEIGQSNNTAELTPQEHKVFRAVGKAHDARAAIGDQSKIAAFDRMKHKVQRNEAVSQAKSELDDEDIEGRLTAIEKEDRIEQLLAEMKAKQG